MRKKYPKDSRVVKIADDISDIIYKAMMALAHIFSLILINLGNFVILTIKFFVSNFRPFINFFYNFTKTIQHRLGTFSLQILRSRSRG